MCPGPYPPTLCDHCGALARTDDSALTRPRRARGGWTSRTRCEEAVDLWGGGGVYDPNGPPRTLDRLRQPRRRPPPRPALLPARVPALPAAPPPCCRRIRAAGAALAHLPRRGMVPTALAACESGTRFDSGRRAPPTAAVDRLGQWTSSWQVRAHRSPLRAAHIASPRGRSPRPPRRRCRCRRRRRRRRRCRRRHLAPCRPRPRPSWMD